MSRFRFSPVLRVTAGLATAGMVIAAGFAGCGRNSAIVGGQCATGYTQCSLSCVDTQNDPENCGACGHACLAGHACVAGQCSEEGDASPDALSDAPIDVILGDGHFRDGFAPDSPVDASTDTPVTDVVTSDACMPPYDTPAACGDCFTVCSGVNDACKQSDAGSYGCVPLCDPPLSECAGQCFDEQNDPNNCGTCGKICPSNLCAGGLCQGVTPGDIIVMGHDYNTTLPGSSQARALSNAVFLPSSNPLRILSFEHYADATSVARVKAILMAAGTAQGRMLTITVSNNDADVPSNLNILSYDLLLVYDQESATTGTLTTLGATWAPTLATFLSAGGVVVALDGAAGTTQEMPQFESSAGLLQVTSHTPMASGTHVTVVAPGDAVAVGVLSPYGAAKNSVHYATSEANGGNVAYVVDEPISGEPVVVHKVVP